jgi:cobalt/nickel transport system permease protein
VGAVAVGLHQAGRRLNDRVVPLLGVTGAFVFAAQMLNFPVAGGTSGHFLGAALATVLLGPWLACLVLAVVLATQSYVFADGGVSALGANVLNMGVIGALAAGGLMLAARRVLPRRRGVLLGVHVVIGLGEAVITVAALSALTATRPDLIGAWAPDDAPPSHVRPIPHGA